MNNPSRDLTVYVLVRTDIPSMNAGKGMAQVHHSGVQMMAIYHDESLVKEYIKQGAESGANGFNTTITLGANREQIEIVQEKVNDFYERGHSCLNGQVLDPSYPFLVNLEVWEWANSLNPNVKSVSTDIGLDMVLVTRSELTCAWFLGDRNDPEFKALFDGLSLHA